MICTCWPNPNIDHLITHVRQVPTIYISWWMFDKIVADVSSVAHTTPVVPVSRIEFAEDLTCNITSVSSLLANQLFASESQHARDHGQSAVVTTRVKLDSLANSTRATGAQEVTCNNVLACLLWICLISQVASAVLI